MLIDVYGLLPWSRTAADQPRAQLTRRTNSFFGRLLFVLTLLLVFPVMVNSIEPVPSSSWFLSVDPSYMPPSTSRTEAQVEGSGLDETTTPAPTPSYFSWYTGRRAHRKQNTSSVDAAGQNPKRRESRIDHDAVRRGDDRDEDEEERIGEEEIADKFLTEPPPAAAVVRWYRLYNRCSGGYLQMYMNDVNARGKFASPLAQLRVETDSYGSRIRIQSEKFGKYLCFNRRQRITSKYNGRSERCVFVEKISDNHYTELESAWRPGLYLGFNRGDGKFLDPSRYYSDRRTCFQFIKTSNSSSIDAFAGGVFSQQQQVHGPTDFARLSPERQRWFRARMHQEAEAVGAVGDEDEAWRHKKRQHRLRHERARLRHHNHQRRSDTNDY